MNDSTPSFAQKTVDARRLLCPLPLLRIDAALRQIAPGDLLSLRATDPGLRNDLPVWCRMHGHQLIRLDQEQGELTGLIRKGEPR